MSKQVVLITGALTGIGRATAVAFAQAGHSVVVSGRQPAPNATIDNRFAVIGADFAPQADPGSVRVRLDGNDITGRAGVSGSAVSFVRLKAQSTSAVFR